MKCIWGFYAEREIVPRKLIQKYEYPKLSIFPYSVCLVLARKLGSSQCP